MGPRGEKSHHVRSFRQRRNTSCQGSEYWHHRRELPLWFRVLRKSHTETFDQVALVVQESEVKLRMLEEEVDTRVRQREVDKGKSRML